ncbi:MAG: carboxypeptidase-like regulatory domain-containing protein, partial [Bacteroidales bacterium]
MKHFLNQLHNDNVKRNLVTLGLTTVLCIPPISASTLNDVNTTNTPAEQGYIVKGNILDEQKQPMIGVSVVVKGTTNGTITDLDGNFSISVPSPKAILEISYIGYKTQEIAAGHNTSLNITMDPDTKALDEVVVIGYGTVKKRDLTGAVVSVKSEEITLN